MKFLYRAYAVLIAIGLGAFGYQVWGLARQAGELWQITSRLDSTDALLNQEVKEIATLTTQTKAQSQELVFLQGLQNIMPQDKGFLRTQNAMLEEVQSLRRQVGQRLHGHTHIVVDTKANKLYLKKGLTLLMEADCSVGKGGVLTDPATGRRWEFVTPRGQFVIEGKMEKPLWIKPDWAFVELKQPIPPPDDPSRAVEGELGGYFLDLGDGYLIHGTSDEELLGRPVSHGCVRLGKADLEKLYQLVPIGTTVYIY